MCSIFGWVDINNELHPLAKRIIMLDSQRRGEDGTGFMTLTESGDPSIWKTDKPISKSLFTRVIPDRMLTNPFVLGHTRRPSNRNGDSGVSRKNSHPFRHDNIIGAHNGFIRNSFDIKYDYKDQYKFIDKYTVDSQFAIFLIWKLGLDALKEIEGVASIWWYNTKEPGFFYLWCWGQDLSYFESDGKFVFASEAYTLHSAGFDGPGQNSLPWTITKDAGSLYRIDIKTAKVEHVGKYPGKTPKVYTPTTPIQTGLYGNSGTSFSGTQYGDIMSRKRMWAIWYANNAPDGPLAEMARCWALFHLKVEEKKNGEVVTHLVTEPGVEAYPNITNEQRLAVCLDALYQLSEEEEFIEAKALWWAAACVHGSPSYPDLKKELAENFPDLAAKMPEPNDKNNEIDAVIKQGIAMMDAETAQADGFGFGE